jgi:hypothetical protein
MFQAKAVEKIKTHLSCTNNYFFEKCYLWDNVKKSIVGPGRPNSCMAHANCMLDTQGYKQTLWICNTFSFSTATMVERTLLIVTLHVQSLSYLNSYTISYVRTFSPKPTWSFSYVHLCLLARTSHNYKQSVSSHSEWKTYSYNIPDN